MAPSTSASTLDSDELSLSCLSAMISSLWMSACEFWHNITRQRLVFFLKQHVPILDWLPSYNIQEDLQFDVVSGITVGLMLVPQEVSLSAIMGVPPIYGLYTAAVVPMIYSLFGTSRVLSVANGAEVSLLVGSAIKKVESEEERIATGILLSFLSGVILLFMGMFRLGVIADFFSRPVMGGFLSAGGVLIMLSQVASWLGLEVKSRDLPVLTVLDLFQHFPELNGLSFAVGLVSITVLVSMHELKRRVVKELARVENEFEDQFAIETSRALTQLSISMEPSSDDQVKASDDDEDQEAKVVCQAAANTEITVESEGILKPLKRQARKKEKQMDTNAISRSVSPRGTRWANLPAVFTTGALQRRDYVLSSPWGSLSRKSQEPSSNEADLARSCRQKDLAAITRNNLHGRMDDEGVGFSLSDEDFITIERPLDFGTRQDTATDTGMFETQNIASDTAVASMKSSMSNGEILDTKTQQAKAKTELKRRVQELVSPTKSDTESELADPSSALTGRMLAASSLSIRLLRSKMAVLVSLRLLCDLGAFMVCLLGGIVGYLAPTGSLNLAGDIPGGYPALKRPWYGLSDDLIDADSLYHLFIDTLSIAIISYMCSIAMAKRLAIKEGYRIRPNQELIALGFSNLIGSFFQGMPSTGGLSRTAVNMQNARTQLASVITVLVVVFVLYTATSALAYLPKASLASIIIVAGFSLIELKEAKWLYRVKRDEFYVWLASFVLSCLLGVLPGLLSSIFCSLIAVIYKTRRPIVSLLGEVPDEETGEIRIVDLDLYPDTAQSLLDVVAIRVEGALYFANCEYIERVVEREVRKRHATTDVAVRGVVIDAASIMDWDSTTIQMMKHLKEELRGQGIKLAIVNARDRLHDLLQTSEFLVGIVHNDARIPFSEAIQAIRDDSINLNDNHTLARSLRIQSI
ncbi:hypothetical protein CCR75_006482 [Bremia lactucae]|uniref:STAS domain-containing protein n=1 Tax=Bremia lactucae TaxID=4779 RepID=A0A976FH69_BRELC|nr:hypothetical protein CCR75_006482 [Bremia lactucae]